MSASRPASRSCPSHTSSSSLPYVPQVESLILPDGPVGGDAVELLDEFVHPSHRHEASETLIGDDADRGQGEAGSSSSANLPWWKRPSPWWLLTIIPFTSIAMSATIAPRIEIYTILACSVHKPDIFRQSFPGGGLGYFKQSIDNPLHVDVFPVGFNTSSALDLGNDRVYLSGLDQSDPNESQIPPKKNLCAADPDVQAAVAKLTAVITTCMGILSCITTGWWGAFSDRKGRTRVMGISVFGLLLTDWNFIFVSKFSKYLPGGYWFLVLGPIVEGFLGGMTSAVAAMHAYIADTTTESSRSRIFSLSLGLLFTGMALGPSFGGILIRLTGSTLSVFYVAAGLHMIYAVLVWFVIPESLGRDKQEKSQTMYTEELTETAREREQNPTVGFLVRLKRIFSFLSPLTIFIPTVINESGNPLKKAKRDWNLTLMGITYGVTISLMGSYSYKFQYAAMTFGWNSEILGYWLSLVGAARAFFLTLLLPVAIKIFKPKPVYIDYHSESSETQPLLSESSGSSSSSVTQAPQKPTFKKEVHSPAFDLGLARVSLFIDVISYLAMALSPTPIAFTAFGMIAAMGAGFNPAAQTVTLSLYTRRGGTETGRLFGALSVIQALSSQILGPALYGMIYMNTVATFPRAIFFVSVGTLFISFFTLSLVRLPKDIHPKQSDGDLDVEESESHRVREETLVDIAYDADDIRGRKKQATPIVTVTSPTD